MLVGVAVIFAIDTFAPLDIAIAVLYAVVVIASADFLGRRGILLVCAVCVLQTLLSYAIVHGESHSKRAGAPRLDRPLRDRHCDACRTQEPGSGGKPERPGGASRFDPRCDLRARQKRCHHLLECRGRGALRLATKGSAGQKAHALLKTRYLPSAGTTEQLDNSSRWQGELIHTRRDGNEVWVVSRWAVQRDERGRPVATMETNSDITEQKHAEDALHHVRSQLEHVTRISTLGELTASIAHEVNQPLAAIVTNGEAGLRWLLRDEPDLEEVRKAVERMIGNGRRASEVIDPSSCPGAEEQSVPHGTHLERYRC